MDRRDGLVDFQNRESVSVETPLVRGLLNMFWLDFGVCGVRDTHLQDAAPHALGAPIVDTLEGGAAGVFCDIEM